MKTAAVVPIKSPHQAKTRLSAVMSQQGRASLAREMLYHVLDVLSCAEGIGAVGVITPDAHLPLPQDVERIGQDRPGLNSLLEQGREWAEDIQADALLVIFADLPLLLVEEIEDMLALARDESTVVLAPDRHHTGTNAMLVRPPKLACFAFGENSLARHRSLAEEAGATVVEYFSEGTSFDVDNPDDLALVKRKSMKMGVRVA